MQAGICRTETDLSDLSDELRFSLEEYSESEQEDIVAVLQDQTRRAWGGRVYLVFYFSWGVEKKLPLWKSFAGMSILKFAVWLFPQEKVYYTHAEILFL